MNKADMLGGIVISYKPEFSPNGNGQRRAEVIKMMEVSLDNSKRN